MVQKIWKGIGSCKDSVSKGVYGMGVTREMARLNGCVVYSGSHLEYGKFREFYQEKGI